MQLEIIILGARDRNNILFLVTKQHCQIQRSTILLKQSFLSQKGLLSFDLLE